MVLLRAGSRPTPPYPTSPYYYDWISLASKYTGTQALYSGSENTAVSGVNVAGEWLQIEVPKAFKLTSTYGYPGVLVLRI